ncbi:MAG TPA: type II toxin-antitoxin system VapC family toxin [Jiangellaceae bacterium]|nr:type II toxin-antitoxin system VapC family toxin [Jiangellaceae bacterium]
MTERLPTGVLDTSVLIDMADIPEEALPATATISAVTLAELAQGPHLATDARQRALRIERLQLVESTFRALPFDSACARKYGTLVALTLEAGRHPRPRRVDLMIAATAAAQDLPLYTRNPGDFAGLDSAVLLIPV